MNQIITMSCSEKEAGSITLPQENVFRNLKNAKRFAIDIGRTLKHIEFNTSFRSNLILNFINLI